MLNKFKNIVILLFFLAAVYLFLFMPSGYNRIDGEDMLFLLFFILGACALSAIFQTSLSKTEKKINGGEYKLNWVLKFNLLLAFLLYVALVIFSIVFAIISTQFLGAQSEAGLLVFIMLYQGLWIAPLSVFIFSVIPSWFYFRFYSNKKLLNLVPWIFVILSVFLIVFYFSSVSTCNFNKNYECVAGKAIKTQNVSTCENIKEGFIRGLCYYRVSRDSKNAVDVSMCNNISDDIIKNSCIVNVAINAENRQICEGIKTDQNGYGKDNCYSDFQIKLKR